MGVFLGLKSFLVELNLYRKELSRMPTSQRTRSFLKNHTDDLAHFLYTSCVLFIFFLLIFLVSV